jgi:hypothetical protein
MRAGRAGVAVLVLLLALAGCAAPPRSAPSSAAPSSAAPSDGPPHLSLDALESEPVENHDETVAMAFDADEAARLLERVPPDLDFETGAVVCVFLGPRQTSGWSLELQTASLRDDVLTIRARETAPRGETRDEVTYPADCGVVTRAALPVGQVTVRADDTVTGEFIADAVIEVPPLTSAP